MQKVPTMIRRDFTFPRKHFENVEFNVLLVCSRASARANHMIALAADFFRICGRGLRGEVGPGALHVPTWLEFGQAP